MKKGLLTLLVAVMALAMTGTAFAAVNVTGRDLLNLDGTLCTAVSFMQTPVISGQGTGETLYVVSGGPIRDQNAAGSGVSVWEVMPDMSTANVVWHLPQGNSNVTASPSSPVLRDNGAGGNSIFFVFNSFDGSAGVNAGVSGFVLLGMSADSQGRDPISLRFETGITNLGVFGTLAYTERGWLGGTLSGTSLYFGTVDIESGSTNVGHGGANPRWVAGNSVYCINMQAVGAIGTDSANKVVAFRYEAGISGFAHDPVISENRDGVSIYMVGGIGMLSVGGNTIYCYNGATIDRNLDIGAQAAVGQRGWVIGPHQTGVGIKSAVGNGAVLATPSLGDGNYSGSNIYSGNSLFIVDVIAGVSVFDKRTGAFAYTVAYGDNTAVGAALPVQAGPVTDGRFLALCSDAGVSVFNSTAVNALSTNVPLWRAEFNIANGWDRNYRIYGTPAISNGYLIVPLGSADGFGNEGQGPGMIAVYRLNDGQLMETAATAGSLSASPIISQRFVYSVGYRSAVYRMSFTDGLVRGFNHWRQFKFGPAKTGENTRPDARRWISSDGACFISTIK
ncbi:MAG: hypothetical protein SV375_02225 [Thermodesulfobacteriota bacterium]|nr:hypothetical protein [Thermodesulfobacteriota bacterium]